MMNYKSLTACLVLLLAVTAFAVKSTRDNSRPTTALTRDFQTYIDANKILMFVTNKGSFAFDNGVMLGKADGLYYPYTGMANIENGLNTTSVIYAASIWMGAVIANTLDATSSVGDTLVTSGQHDTDWGEGPLVFDAGVGWSVPVPGAIDDLRYRVYKLYGDALTDDSADYRDWPSADGAPVDANGDPLLPGGGPNQVCWSVYNDLDLGAHVGAAGTASGKGLGVEVRQMMWAYKSEGALANMVFARFRIFNKGPHDLEDMYVSLWADPDLGSASDDLVGCDTVLSLGYCYNAGPMDTDYGSRPPAVGYDFFQGPLIYTDDTTDVAIMWDFQEFPGYTNMGMTSYNKYVNPYGPDDATDSYEFMTGLQKDGTPLVFGNDTTKFFGWGDPVAGTGFLDADPADRRWMQSTGPFTMNRGDSTEIVAAIIVGQGTDYLNSITELKEIDDFAQIAYDKGFQLPLPPAPPDVTVTNLDGRVSIHWGTRSEDNPGDYPFEGYALMQGESAGGPWTDTLGWYDIINEHDRVVDYRFDPLLEEEVPWVKKPGTNEGLFHAFSTTQDFVGGVDVINYTDYFYKVEAYSVDTSALVGWKALTSATVVSAMPQPPLVGTEHTFPAADTLVVQVTGAADGSVTVTSIQPEQITGDDYKIAFTDFYVLEEPRIIVDTTVSPPDTTIIDTIHGIVWHMINTTTGDTLLANKSNQGGEGPGDYLVIDGFQVVVRGPDPGVKVGDMYADPDNPERWGWDIPNGTRRFTWAQADGFGWEGFRGALGWGGPGDSHGFGGYDPVDPATLPNVLLQLATVDEDGNFDPNDPNVSYGYRYMRNAGNPPARPEFAPFIIDPSASYQFQAFEQNVPLSAWNVDVDPPQRLVVGFLENNVVAATLDGQWFPQESDSLGVLGVTNVSSDGPREWLWIYLDDYSETPNAAYQLNAIDDPMPIMYWLTVARRGSDVPFSPGVSGEDEFLIFPNKVNSPAITFTFSTAGFEASVATEGDESLLESIKAVPNPYYLFSSYDASVVNREMKFINLPTECTITIYNLGGDQVRQLEKNDNATELTWDMSNHASIPVASGIYIYVVEAPGFGQKIGKMAIFTETEQLNQF